MGLAKRVILGALVAVLAGCAYSLGDFRADMREMPPVERKTITTGDSHERFLPKFVAFAKQKGYSTEFHEQIQHMTPDGPVPILGGVNATNKTVYINSSKPKNTQVETFAHELAHLYQPRYLNEIGNEIFAEAVAVVVTEGIGLRESHTQSREYLSHMGENLVLLEKLDEEINAAARDILKGVR